jgi:hypothetical protein
MHHSLNLQFRIFIGRNIGAQSGCLIFFLNSQRRIVVFRVGGEIKWFHQTFIWGFVVMRSIVLIFRQDVTQKFASLLILKTRSQHVKMVINILC